MLSLNAIWNSLIYLKNLLFRNLSFQNRKLKKNLKDLSLKFKSLTFEPQTLGMLNQWFQDMIHQSLMLRMCLLRKKNLVFQMLRKSSFQRFDYKDHKFHTQSLEKMIWLILMEESFSKWPKRIYKSKDQRTPKFHQLFYQLHSQC